MPFTDEILSYIDSKCLELGATDATITKYAKMKYPRVLPMFKISTHRYYLEDFGTVMVMSTSAMGGLMKLVTASFTPFEGKNVPYLLVDCMHMLKTSLAYVEYYNCTSQDLDSRELDSVATKYASVPDYSEKPAWYISERMPCSLIKGGKGVDSGPLVQMVKDSVDAYLKCVAEASSDSNNVVGLKEFQRRMIKEGNPSQPTMRKVLGDEGADEFFCSYVMPMGLK